MKKNIGRVEGARRENEDERGAYVMRLPRKGKGKRREKKRGFFSRSPFRLLAHGPFPFLGSYDKARRKFQNEEISGLNRFEAKHHQKQQTPKKLPDAAPEIGKFQSPLKPQC